MRFLHIINIIKGKIQPQPLLPGKPSLMRVRQ